MLNDWLANALHVSGIKQADLARSLTDLLGRTIDGGAVSRMLSGERRISGDEMIEISRLCEFPIPPSIRTDPRNQAVPILSHEDFTLPMDCMFQMSVGSLLDGISHAYLRMFPQLEQQVASVLAEQVLFQIQRDKRFTVLIGSETKDVSKLLDFVTGEYGGIENWGVEGKAAGARKIGKVERGKGAMPTQERPKRKKTLR